MREWRARRVEGNVQGRQKLTFFFFLSSRQYLLEEKEQLKRNYDNSQLDLLNTNEQNRELRKQVSELKEMVEARAQQLVSCARSLGGEGGGGRHAICRRGH